MLQGITSDGVQGIMGDTYNKIWVGIMQGKYSTLFYFSILLEDII